MSLNDFEIIKQIGTGAFSTVSLVKRKQDDTIYALKRVELSKMLPNEKDNSLNEIRLLASVNHRNIISYKESFYEESTNTLNLILEYADAGDLQSKIIAHKNAGKYFNEKTIWSIFIQMVNGIKELHDRNIIHRDLKSANIFLMKNGICKLGDLNVSKVANSGLLKTQTGTPYFASPEVWSGKPYGLKSDIWSLGCILYQIATLKMPFQGNNFKEVYNNISKCKYQPLPSVYSKELDLIIKKLLQIDPEKRPNCQQILKDPIVIGKLKSLLGTDLYSIFEEEKETEENLSKKKADNEVVKKINNDKINNSRKHKTTSHLLKTIKYSKDSDINDILPKNKRYKMYNNYRIFKNYDTNPSSNKEEKNKIYNENDNKLCNDINTDNINKNGTGKNRIFQNKSKIEKYKTFLKAKSNLSELENKSESIKRNNSINKTINKTRSIPYINHQNKTEGNSKNKKIENSNSNSNNNQVKIPFLITKNKKQFNVEPKRIKFGIPRNLSNTTQKMPRKSLSENKNSKYYNIKNFNNYQYKKITPLITNSINENEYDKEINDNIRDINMWNNYRHINRLSDIVNQTDIDNKDSHQNTAEKGKSYTYDKKLENKNSFNLGSKQNRKNCHSLSKNKVYLNKNFEENKESNYNKQFRKSIPIRKSINKNISAAAIEDYPVRPTIKISNLFNNEGFNEFNSKINSYLSNNCSNSFHYSFKKRNVKRNNSTFEMNDKAQKLFRIHATSLKSNNSQNGIGIDKNNLSKNKYSIHSEKLKMPNTKMSKTKIKINKYSTKNHKKLLFKKNIINILEYNQYDNKDISNKNLYNLINYSNTTSNRKNIYRKNNNSENSKNNTNIYKSISSISIDKPLIYNTQSNNINLTNNYYSNKIDEDYSRDNSKDNLIIEAKKISAFKFDEFKQKKMKKELNCNNANNINDNLNEKTKKFKFNHMPFINTPNKENEPNVSKQRENPSFSDKNNKNIDPTIKMLINPIKIIEKKNFKRKLFPLRPQVKLNRLNILNNTSYKNNNKEYVTSIQKNI